MRRPSDIEADVCRRTLTYRQVERLTDVVDSHLQVPGRGNYPTLKMSVRKLVEAVRRRLDADNMTVNDIRVNGGAASYIVIGDDDQVIKVSSKMRTADLRSADRPTCKIGFRLELG